MSTSADRLCFPMGWGLLASLLLALGSLALAAYTSSPDWISFLVLTGGCLGLAAGLATGLLLRWRWPRSWGPAASLALALAAALGRASLIGQISREPLARLTIDFFRMAVAASTVVWAAMALLWGTRAIAHLLHPLPARPRALLSRRGPRWWISFGAATSAVSLSLYGISPLLALLGLRLNHWTLLGLFGLAIVAYGVGTALQRIAAMLGRQDENAKRRPAAPRKQSAAGGDKKK